MHYFAPTLTYTQADQLFVFKDEGCEILTATPLAVKCLQEILGRLINADDVQWIFYPAFGDSPMWSDEDDCAVVLCVLALVPRSVYGQNVHSKDAVFFPTWN